MDLKTYLSLERGRISALARAIEAFPSDVSAWKAGTRPIPVHFGLPIEQATSGQVTRLELFPREVIEKVWPELLRKKHSRASKADSSAASDDVQPNPGGSVGGTSGKEKLDKAFA